MVSRGVFGWAGEIFGGLSFEVLFPVFHQGGCNPDSLGSDFGMADGVSFVWLVWALMRSIAWKVCFYQMQEQPWLMQNQ